MKQRPATGGDTDPCCIWPETLPSSEPCPADTKLAHPALQPTDTYLGPEPCQARAGLSWGVRPTCLLHGILGEKPALSPLSSTRGSPALALGPPMCRALNHSPSSPQGRADWRSDHTSSRQNPGAATSGMTSTTEEMAFSEIPCPRRAGGLAAP